MESESAMLRGLLAAAKVDYLHLAAACGALVVLAIAGYALITLVRRRLYGKPAPTTPQAFTLHELRQLYRQGQLTEEEYQRVKEKALARFPSSEASSTPSADADGGNIDGEDGTLSS